jgi:trimethylamine--corrinoid protein Co-methyltransferase
MRNVVPYLPPANIRKIDAAGREVLSRVGVKVAGDGFLERLRRSGARVDSETQKVFMDDAWLEARLASAPSRVTLHGRRPDLDVRLGRRKVYFGNGGRVFQILDTTTGRMRQTLMADIARAACLVDALANLDVFVIPCQAYDIPADHYHLNDFFQAFNHTEKPVMGGCDTLAGAKEMHALASVIAGGEAALAKRPFVAVITNPISPLTFDAVTLQTIEFCTGKSLPLTCAPAPIAGATAPTTLAGALTQMHAEALAAVALVQFLRPGTPVLYGAVPSAMDLRKMNLSMGSVETAMMSAAAVSLAHLHHLPIYASAGLTDAKVPDIQAGGEKMLSKLLVAQAGADFIHLAAGMLDSGNAICLDQFVIDDEAIGMIRRLLRGIDVNTDTLALEPISSVGPGGNFVLVDHTVNHMMDQYFYPRLSVRMPFDVWTAEGEPTLVSRARETVTELLAKGRARLDNRLLSRIGKRFPAIEGAVVKAGEGYLTKKRKTSDAKP